MRSETQRWARKWCKRLAVVWSETKAVAEPKAAAVAALVSHDSELALRAGFASRRYAFILLFKSTLLVHKAGALNVVVYNTKVYQT